MLCIYAHMYKICLLIYVLYVLPIEMTSLVSDPSLYFYGESCIFFEHYTLSYELPLFQPSHDMLSQSKKRMTYLQTILGGEREGEVLAGCEF